MIAVKDEKNREYLKVGEWFQCNALRVLLKRERYCICTIHSCLNGIEKMGIQITNQPSEKRALQVDF